MRIGFFEALKRLHIHDLFPVLHGDITLTAAVLIDVIYSFRRICIFYQRPGCTGLPYSDHRDNGKYSSRQSYKDKILLADTGFLEPRIQLARHLIELGISYTLRINLIKQDRRIRTFLGVFGKPLYNRAHITPPSVYSHNL